MSAVHRNRDSSEFEAVFAQNKVEDVITTLYMYGLMFEGALYNDKDPKAMRSYLNANLSPEESIHLKRLAVVSGHRGINFSAMPEKSKDKKVVSELISSAEMILRSLDKKEKPPFELSLKVAMFAYPEFMYAGSAMSKDSEVVQNSNPVSMLLGNTSDNYAAMCRRFASTRQIQNVEGFLNMRALQADSIKNMSSVMDKEFMKALTAEYNNKYKNVSIATSVPDVPLQVVNRTQDVDGATIPFISGKHSKQ